MTRRLIVLGVLTLVPAIVWAQDTASHTGTVRDTTAAVIPDTTVVIGNTANGLTRNLTANTDGEYLAAALPTVRYNIYVAARILICPFIRHSNR